MKNHIPFLSRFSTRKSIPAFRSLPTGHSLLHRRLTAQEIVQSRRLLTAAVLQPQPHRDRHTGKKEDAVIRHFLLRVGAVCVAVAAL